MSVVVFFYPRGRHVIRRYASSKITLDSSLCFGDHFGEDSHNLQASREGLALTTYARLYLVEGEAINYLLEYVFTWFIWTHLLQMGHMFTSWWLMSSCLLTWTSPFFHSCAKKNVVGDFLKRVIPKAFVFCLWTFDGAVPFSVCFCCDAFLRFRCWF